MMGSGWFRQLRLVLLTMVLLAPMPRLLVARHNDNAKEATRTIAKRTTPIAQPPQHQQHTAGTLWEHLPVRSFSPHAFLYADPRRVDLWKRNQKLCFKEYIYFQRNATTNDTTTIKNTHQQEGYLYIHVKKAGGTLLRSFNFQRPVAYHAVQKLFGSHLQRKPAVRQQVARWLEQAADDNNNNQTSHHALKVHPFSFIRDPATRFLSGLGELIHNPSIRQAIAPCLQGRNTTRVQDTLALVHCVLDRMERGEEGTDNASSNTYRYLNAHIMPQVLELHGGLQQRPNVTIHLLNLRDMDGFLQRVVNIHTQAPIQRVRSRAVGTLAPDTIFTADPSLLPRICRIYQIDLDMLAALDALVPSLCDDVAW